MKKFGEGMTEREYVRARLIFACATAELEGSDGWHDGTVHPAPQHAELEKVVEDCILDASLGVGGAIYAQTPYYTGLVDEIARAISSDAPAAEREQARIAAHASFLQLAINNLIQRGVEL